MTETAEYKELRRARDDRMLGGVCAGLGRYFDVNPVFYRIGFVVLALLGGAGILVYGAAVLVIPNEGEEDSIAGDILRHHRQRPVAVVGLALVALAAIALLSRLSWHFSNDAFWVIVLVGGGLLLLAQRRPAAAEAGEAAAPRPRRRWLLITFATLGTIFVLTVATVTAFVAPHLHLGDGIGDRSYQPVTALRDDYRLGIGDLDLDLSALRLPPGSTTIHAQVGIGKLDITVPRDVTVRVKSDVDWGGATVFALEQDGHDIDTDVGPARARLVLDTQVGIGDVTVNRAVR